VRVLILALSMSMAMAGAASAQNQNQNIPANITQLHNALHLTPTQDPAWKAYLAAVAPNPQMSARRNAAQSLLPQLPTPRRIALIEATMEQDVTDFRRQGDAVMAFYNQLSPEQQRTFDRQTQPPAQTGQ